LGRYNSIVQEKQGEFPAILPSRLSRLSKVPHCYITNIYGIIKEEIMGEIRVPEEQSTQFCSGLFQKIGASREHADIVGDHLTFSELRGLYSHGLSRVMTYSERLEKGAYNKNPHIRVVKEGAGTATLDADKAFGAVSGVYAMELCMEKAKKNGTASVAVKNANHYGCLAYYTLAAAKRGMIGFTMCNCSASTSVWGSNGRVLGTNPFSVAIPADKKRPVVYDGATSVVAQGKVAVANIEKRSIPGHWCYDKEGNPTSDGTAAFHGAMRPFGDYKGSGISMLIALICAGLCDTYFDMEEEMLRLEQDLSAGGNLSDFFTVIDIAAFTDPEKFKRRVDVFVDLVKMSRRITGTAEIYVPGELEFNKVEEFRARGGFTIGPNLFAGLKAARDRYGFDFDMDRWVTN
jgi:LDH2 family malate/lactate/ureidoglycolate dehydrogenase